MTASSSALLNKTSFVDESPSVSSLGRVPLCAAFCLQPSHLSLFITQSRVHKGKPSSVSYQIIKWKKSWWCKGSINGKENTH